MTTPTIPLALYSNSELVVLSQACTEQMCPIHGRFVRELRNRGIY